MREDLTAEQVRTARLVAIVADALQVLLLPAFFPAAVPPANNLIDLAVAIILLRLLGWHWAFLPAFLAELVPFVDLVPSWTAAVYLATRNHVGAAEAPTVVVETTATKPDERPALPAGAQEPRGPSGE
jgi:hypothetical protein